MVPYQGEEKVKLCAIVRHCVGTPGRIPYAYVPAWTCLFAHVYWTKLEHGHLWLDALGTGRLKPERPAANSKRAASPLARHR